MEVVAAVVTNGGVDFAALVRPNGQRQSRHAVALEDVLVVVD